MLFKFFKRKHREPIPIIRRDSTGHWRKWSTDAVFDVVIWYREEDGKTIDAFQVFIKDAECPEHEVGFSWDETQGFEVVGSGKVDRGEQTPQRQRSHIIVPAKLKLDFAQVVENLRVRQVALDLTESEIGFIESQIALGAKPPTGVG